ncbi:hypothetical protein LTR78_009666 [Recurvomyces mirabilis]|uniref:Uncharacterized protein n=1 Tax=Recurvomyces mirabilis TaxID=574656 RepID=A0AAE0TTB3_9PEZI|nr:hypothetical protein LTR78_009666 [Recurvomyces mirabilis]KAK5150292.1 hypothetical protein LTS14_010269 [Recurvomyces mirabilis]
MESQTFTLFTIPPEMRLNIYKLLLDEAQCLRYFVHQIVGSQFFVSEIDDAQAASNQQIKRTYIALLQTSRAINQESTALRGRLMLSFTGRLDVWRHSVNGEEVVFEDDRMVTSSRHPAFLLDNSVVRAARIIALRISTKGTVYGTTVFRHVIVRRDEEVVAETAGEDGIVLANTFGQSWTIKDECCLDTASNRCLKLLRREGWQI